MVSANRQKAAIRQSQLSLISINEANQAVFASLLDPGDVILGLSLSCGGHLTHGAEPSLSGKWFRSIQYTVNRDTYLLDMDEYVMVIDPLVAWRLLSGARATAGLLSWAESVDRLLRIIGNAVYSFP
ncbi:Serine hydroxymethyltransferase [Dirofilaria immitis]